MIRISTRDETSQRVILNTLFDITNLNIRIDGELIISLNEEEKIIKIFLELLHQNLVELVGFYYEEEITSNVDASKAENVCVTEAEASTNEDSRTTNPSDKKEEKKGTNKSPWEIVRNFFKENESKFFTIKEASDITGLKYQTVAGAIRSMYLKNNFLVRTEDKKYGYIDPEQVQEESSKESTSNMVAHEQEEPSSKPTSNVEEEVQENQSSKPTLNVEAQEQKEPSSKPTLTVEEKLKIMRELFSKEQNLDVLRYIFPTKGSFVVSLAQKKFVGEAQKDLTRIIRTLNELELITFDEKFKGGRYFVNKKWRLWSFLFLKGKAQTKESIRYQISMSDGELKETIEQAVSENIVIKTQEEGKCAIYSVIC